MAQMFTWQVTGQSPQVQFDAQGNVTNGQDITFKINETGYTGTIFVPDTFYANPDNVRELIQNRVNALTAVHQLNG